MSKINLSGKIGNNCDVSNAHKIEIGTSQNGSGDDAFGGADKWPTIHAEVSFQAGEELRALNFAKKLTELIKSEFAARTTTERG